MYDRPASFAVVFDPQNPAAHRAVGSMEPSNVDGRRFIMLGAAAVAFEFILRLSGPIEWLKRLRERSRRGLKTPRYENRPSTQTGSWLTTGVRGLDEGRRIPYGSSLGVQLNPSNSLRSAAYGKIVGRLPTWLIACGRAVDRLCFVIRMARSMKYFVSLSALLVLIGSPVRLETSAAVQTAANQQQEMVQTYCVTCHSTRARMGGLALEGLNPQAAAANAEIWEKALRKLRGNQMPPPGSPQPPQKDVESFVAWMENALDTNAKGPKAGYVPIQRLNRTEYAASVKALVGVDVNPKDVLPQDIQVEGFDNIADALSVSPAFLDQYVTAARHIAQIAVGNPNPRVSSVKYPIDANQNPDNPLPLGTWGGMKFKHSFPADGEYQITLTNLAVGPYSNALERENTVVILIDGRTVFRQSIGGAVDLSLVDRTAGTGRSQVMDRFSKIPVQVKAGVRDVVVAFVDRPHVETSENLQRLQPYGGLTGGAAPTDRRPHLLDGIAVAGPFNPTGVSMTASRALIFVCDPRQTGEPACARQITEHLARRAFRRPVTTEDVNRLVPFYEAERRNGGTFDQGIEQTVAAVLVSPQFLYRSIRGPKGVTPASEFSLTDLELASRLSFFLWNTGPDEELLTLASSNRLTRPGAMEKQARRMLADPRASSLVTSFAMKWLNLTTLDQVVPDPILFRGFNEQLRRDFSTEAQYFLSSILLDDRSVVDLLNADDLDGLQTFLLKTASSKSVGD
jgi:mono/diheme cytochrome c family protein